MVQDSLGLGSANRLRFPSNMKPFSGSIYWHFVGRQEDGPRMTQAVQDRGDVSHEILAKPTKIGHFDWEPPIVLGFWGPQNYWRPHGQIFRAARWWINTNISWKTALDSGPTAALDRECSWSGGWSSCRGTTGSCWSLPIVNPLARMVSLAKGVSWNGGYHEMDGLSWKIHENPVKMEWETSSLGSKFIW